MSKPGIKLLQLGCRSERLELEHAGSDVSSSSRFCQQEVPSRRIEPRSWIALRHRGKTAPGHGHCLRGDRVGVSTSTPPRIRGDRAEMRKHDPEPSFSALVIKSGCHNPPMSKTAQSVTGRSCAGSDSVLGSDPAGNQWEVAMASLYERYEQEKCFGQLVEFFQEIVDKTG